MESGKIALSDGRGAGTIEIPATAPTGNYRIVAYTAYTKNTPGFNPQEHISKTISIFNTSTKERVKNGVKILSDSEYDALRTPASTPASTPAGTHTTGTHTTGTHSSSTYNAGTQPAAGALSITCHRSAEGYLEVVLTNNSATPADLSLSLSNRDGIIPPDNTSIGAFMGAAASAAQAAGASPHCKGRCPLRPPRRPGIPTGAGPPPGKPPPWAGPGTGTPGSSPPGP